MLIIGSVLLGIAIFFTIVLLTLLLGALGRRDDREILRRNAEDIASGQGSLTQPPSREGHSVSNPVRAG